MMGYNAVAPIGILLFCSLTLISGLAADVGPISIFRRRSKNKRNGGGFSWEASLNNELGTGSSIEKSSIHLEKLEAKSFDTLIPELNELAYDLVEGYPKWLTSFGVTLGLLTLVRENDGNTNDIHLNLIGLNLLTFGRVEQKESNSKLYTIELPVKGGLLSLPPIQTDGDDRGCLRFEYSLDSSPSEGDGSVKYSFQSLIQGNYRPWIAGYPKISRLRKWMYLLSQSMVHAYVMFRFHRLWRRSVCDYLRNQQPV